MKSVLVLSKYPPLQGGVSSWAYSSTRELAARGLDVHVVTHALEAPLTLRERFDELDYQRLSCRVGGGTVMVHFTTALSVDSYIPWANPFSSKLFGLAMAVHERYSCDLILGWYFEPFGLVAAFMAHALNKPFIICHAGSDLSRLARHSDLAQSYRWMLGKADLILTSRRSRYDLERLRDLGARDEAIFDLPPSPLPAYFSSSARAFDLPELLSSAEGWYADLRMRCEVVSKMLDLNKRHFNPEVPTVGIYGKVSEIRGSFDLLAALCRLAEDGVDFNFLSAAAGDVEVLERFYEAILAKPALAFRSFFVPTMPPWKVPGFIKLCDLVCVLERGFSIPSHLSRMPREILAVGACLVISSEMARKQPFFENLSDSCNCVIVEDPSDIDSLARKIGPLLRDRARIRTLAGYGRYVSRVHEEFLPRSNAIADVVCDFVSGVGGWGRS